MTKLYIVCQCGLNAHGNCRRFLVRHLQLTSSQSTVNAGYETQISLLFGTLKLISSSCSNLLTRNFSMNNKSSPSTKYDHQTYCTDSCCQRWENTTDKLTASVFVQQRTTQTPGQLGQ